MKLNNALDKLALLSHVQGYKYQSKKEETLALIRECQNLDLKTCVAFSAGKDSMVLAHMVLQVDPNVTLRMLTCSETEWLNPVDECVNYWRDKGAHVSIMDTDRMSKFDNWLDMEKDRIEDNDLRTRLTTDYDLVYIGLRSEECRERRMSLSIHQTPGLPRYCFRRRESGQIRSCPLARWTSTDVSACIVENGMPILDTYNENINRRTTLRLSKTTIRMGKLQQLKREFPERWSQVVSRFPELGDL